MGRYSLVALNSKLDSHIIVKILSANPVTKQMEYSEQNNLSTIDKYTINFLSEDDLKSYLFEHDIIPNTNYNLFVEYMSKGEIKKLPLVYKTNKELEYFASNAPIKASTVDPYYKRLINNYLDKFLNEPYLNYLISFGFIDDYVAVYVKEYVKAVKYSKNMRMIEDMRNKIYTNMLRYKTIRGLVIGDYMYHVVTSNIEALEDEIINLYNEGGLDMVYTYYDNDDLKNLSVATRKKLELYF